MDDRSFKLILGSLMHDLGKVVYRARQIDSRAHPLSGHTLVSQFLDDPDVAEIILYHHAKDLRSAKISNDSLAYIAYCADNIAAAADRREVEGEIQSGFDPGRPLASVFNLLNNNESQMNHRMCNAEEFNPPGKISEIHTSEYNRLVQELKSGLGAINWEPEYINSVLELLEAHLSFVPSSTMTGEVPDISLYDHLRLTAALACCIYQYLHSLNRLDFRQELLEREAEFYEEQAFVMFSCDISGIQPFIYTIASKGALKALRARSFYLEVLIEHIVDLILNANSLSRANLIYTGGGHAYILLPNTGEVLSRCQDILNNINRWFISTMGTGLFIAYAFQACSGNELMNIPRQQNPYQGIFRSLSRQLGEKKLKRYDADDIRRLNIASANNSGRECSSCGAVDQLLDSEDICQLCASLHDLSREITRSDTVLVVTQEKAAGQTRVILPNADGYDCFLTAVPAADVNRILNQEAGNILAVYAINKMYTGYKYSTRLWMGNYFDDSGGEMPTFERLAERKEGIERIAVLRADVDNLGAAFISGFVRKKEKDEAKRNRYLTLSRYATLSRQLSMFFKYHINGLLRGDAGMDKRFSLGPDSAHPRRKAVIVYSGGDDMFIVGAWDQVIELAIDLRRAFRVYTVNSLTFSAGIGIYPDKYPVSRMAIEVAELEQAAKEIDEDKDALALFGQSMIKDKRGNLSLKADHLYKWRDFEDGVVLQKLRLLQDYFRSAGDERQAFGNSFLYRLYGYLSTAGDDPINLARYAYLLSRMAPSGQSVPQRERELYQQFSSLMYQWILNERDRRELVTAILLFVYLSRKRKED